MGMFMGHLFVPAALVLWGGVAVVRALATPAPVPMSTPAVHGERMQPSASEVADHPVWETGQAEAPVKGEG